MNDTITLPRATGLQALEALEIGYESADAEAAHYHAAMAGYRPERHAEMDADVQKIAQSITALRAALGQPDKRDAEIAALQAQVNAFYLGTPDIRLLAMTKERDALKVALAQQAEPVAWPYPLGQPVACNHGECFGGECIYKTATQQEAQHSEPVALWHLSGHGYAPVTLEQSHPPEPLTVAEALARGWRRFYAHPPTAQQAERKPLTDEEITEIFESKTRWHYPPIGATDREFARDIERAHGIGGQDE